VLQRRNRLKASTVSSRRLSAVKPDGLAGHGSVEAKLSKLLT
jgi:hypothetical protein